MNALRFILTQELQFYSIYTVVIVKGLHNKSYVKTYRYSDFELLQAVTSVRVTFSCHELLIFESFRECFSRKSDRHLLRQSILFWPSWSLLDSQTKKVELVASESIACRWYIFHKLLLYDFLFSFFQCCYYSLPKNNVRAMILIERDKFVLA